MFRFVKIALVLALTLGMACKKEIPVVDLSATEPRLVLLPEQHDPAEVRGAIIAGMQNKGWVAEGETANEVTARLSHKGANIRVALQYSADRFSIRGISAEGPSRGYEKWISNLEASVREGLKKAAPPPAPVATPIVQPAVKPAPTLVVFEHKQKPDSVKNALQRALAKHSWVIEQEEAGGALIARLNHRKGLVRVRIAPEETQATITYVESVDLDIDGSGRSPEYEKWMRNLVESIRENTRS